MPPITSLEDNAEELDSKVDRGNRSLWLRVVVVAFIAAVVFLLSSRSASSYLLENAVAATPTAQPVSWRSISN